MKAIGKRYTNIPMKYKLIWFSPVLIVAFIVKFPEWRKEYLLSNYGKETYATIELCCIGGLRDDFDVKNVMFSFTSGGKLYNDFESCPVNQNYVLAPFGLPVKPDQKYIVQYYPADPEINRILFDKPLSVNMAGYLFDVVDKLAETEEFCTKDILERMCIALSVFKQFHMDGWANIMFHDEYLLDNFSHNGYSYRRMISSEEFRKITGNCIVK